MADQTKIQSVTDFLNAIYSSSRAKDDQILWFRGESSINWSTPLVPSIYRVLADTFKNIKNDLFNSNNLKQLEKNLSSDFSRYALPFLIARGIENNGWNRYFLMQHYKIKTRLLDWTENALLALFFAIEDQSTFEDDAKVWVLKPYLLNNYTINTILSTNNPFMIIPNGIDTQISTELRNEEGKLVVDELTRRYLRMDFNNGEEDTITNVYYPLAILPYYLDQRMVSQKASFTIFGNKINGLLSIDKQDDILYSIVVDGSKKQKIINELALVGIDHSSAFPDLDGLGMALNLRYKKEFNDNRESLVHIFKSHKPSNI